MTNDNEKEPLFFSLCTNTKYSTDIKSFKFKYKPMKPIVMNHRASVIFILLIVLEVFWSIHNCFFFWKSSYWRLTISFKSSKNFVLNPVCFTCRIKLYQWNPFNITNHYFKKSLKKKGNENLKTQIGIRQCNTSKKKLVNARYYINLKIQMKSKLYASFSINNTNENQPIQFWI